MDRKTRTENAQDLSRYGLGPVEIATLQKLAGQLHRSYEQDCNGRSEVGQLRADKREDRLQADADAVAGWSKLKVYHQTDPRGWPMTIYRSEQLSERFGQGADIRAYYSSIGCAVCPV